MRWDDEGILLTSTPFGEKSEIVSLLTREHGRHKGLFKPSRHDQAIVNVGAILAVNWHARLEDHLGLWKFEPIFSPLGWILSQPLAMQAVLSAIALVEIIFPEREPHPSLYIALKKFICALQRAEDWLYDYILFECALIEHSGFPLDFSQCAATGTTDQLVYVSPRTGRAVSKIAGLPYHERLLPLPSFLCENRRPRDEEIIVALDLTEYFIERYSLGIHGLKMPEARVRLKELLRMRYERKKE